jgi:hypothetical protein
VLEDPNFIVHNFTNIPKHEEFYAIMQWPGGCVKENDKYSTYKIDVDRINAAHRLTYSAFKLGKIKASDASLINAFIEKLLAFMKLKSLTSLILIRSVN